MRGIVRSVPQINSALISNSDGPIFDTRVCLVDSICLGQKIRIVVIQGLSKTRLVHLLMNGINILSITMDPRYSKLLKKDSQQTPQSQRHCLMKQAHMNPNRLLQLCQPHFRLHLVPRIMVHMDIQSRPRQTGLLYMTRRA